VTCAPGRLEACHRLAGNDALAIHQRDTHPRHLQRVHQPQRERPIARPHLQNGAWHHFALICAWHHFEGGGNDAGVAHEGVDAAQVGA
jgi:hypothetical protein